MKVSALITLKWTSPFGELKTTSTAFVLMAVVPLNILSNSVPGTGLLI